MQSLSRVTILLSIFLVFPLSSVLGQNLFIVEVQIAGDKADNDFIKIYNSSNNIVDISGYKLRKRTSNGSESSIRVFPSESQIQAKGYFLWANSKEDFHFTIGANIWSTATLARNNSIALLNPENEILDALAWEESQNPFFKGSPFPENPAPNQRLKRKKANGDYQNTNNNSQDFYLDPSSQPAQSKTETPSKEEMLIEPQLEEEREVTIGKIKSSQIIDLNTTSAKELQKITGIGPLLAQRIIENRPFYSLEELTNVRGIGPKTLEEIKKQGLAWIDPKLEPPKIKKTEAPDNKLAAMAEPFRQGYWARGIPQSLSAFLIALTIAIFSGSIILILKKRIKKPSQD